jgi:hypothetical protein
MEAAEESFSFDPSLYSRRHLCEAALRLLAALGPEPRFPDDPEGVEALLGRVAEGRPGEVMGFATESAEELPRYSGDFLVWVRPAGDGCLRLRHEYEGLCSQAVVLRPDGQLGEFESIDGFGVPESELTPQAIADREAVERRARDEEAASIESERLTEKAQRRFSTEHLLETLAAPSQEGNGPVVTFVALYETGLIVNYLVPRPPEEELESDDPWAEPLEEAMWPRVELSDPLGTAYEVVDYSQGDPNALLLRASQNFVPAVPAEAERLTIALGSRRVEIPLQGR